MALGIALKLAKAGYWGGDVGKIMESPVDEVLAAAQYESFCDDYENKIMELNKESRNG